MKKSSLILCISSLLCASIYSSEWNDCDTGPSKDAFKFSAITHEDQRSPAVSQTIATAKILPQSATQNTAIHTMSERIMAQRRENAGIIYDKIPEYKREKDPKRAFVEDFCLLDLTVLEKEHKSAGFKLDHDRAIQATVNAALRIADKAFTVYDEHNKK